MFFDPYVGTDVRSATRLLTLLFSLRACCCLILLVSMSLGVQADSKIIENPLLRC